MPFRRTALAKGIHVCINNKNSSSDKPLTFHGGKGGGTTFLPVVFFSFPH